MGSSPLTRGGRGKLLGSKLMMGLIPAYAGRTRVCGCSGGLGRAHPRLRGADPRLEDASKANSGSSPLTRGGRVVPGKKTPQIGLIPAYAGRTTGREDCGPWEEAHPRLRGADNRPDILDPENQGSSPLTRGGLGAIGYFVTALGLIPAYAGRTGAPSKSARVTRAHPRLRGADTAPARTIRGHCGSSPLTRGGP